MRYSLAVAPPLLLRDSVPYSYKPDLRRHFEASRRLFLKRFERLKTLDRPLTEAEEEELLLALKAMIETRRLLW